MKKQRPIQIIDFILIFWLLMFLLAPIYNPSPGWQLKLFFWLSSASLLGYLVYVIRLRVKWNQNIEREIQALKEIKTASPSNEVEDNLFYEVKQRVLENMIEKELKTEYPKAKILKNLYCPRPDGTTSEIDLMMICNDGIFLFEAKNYSARLSGNWGNDKLTATYENGKQIEVLNPVIQNSFHFRSISKLIGVNPTQHIIKNIVVLGDAVKFSMDDIRNTTPPYATVCQIKGLVRAIEKKRLISQNVYKDSQVESLYETIHNELSFSPEKKDKHDQNIQEKLGEVAE